MKPHKFRIQHATVTPKPQLKRHMRSAINLALHASKAEKSFNRFMETACLTRDTDRQGSRVERLSDGPREPRTMASRAQSERPAVQSE